MVVRRIMATLGLLAFAVTVLGGTVSNNSLEFTLTRALWALLGFCGVGLVVGWAADRVVREHRDRQHGLLLGDLEAAVAEAESGQDAGAAGAAGDTDEVVDAVAVNG